MSVAQGYGYTISGEKGSIIPKFARLRSASPPTLPTVSPDSTLGPSQPSFIQRGAVGKELWERSCGKGAVGKEL
jgi:hypothetical protein